MNRTRKTKNRLLSVLLFCALVAAPSVVKADTQKAAEKDRAPSDIGNFSYSSQDRRDPFEQVHVLKGIKKDALLNQNEKRL